MEFLYKQTQEHVKQESSGRNKNLEEAWRRREKRGHELGYEVENETPPSAESQRELARVWKKRERKREGMNIK